MNNTIVLRLSFLVLLLLLPGCVTLDSSEKNETAEMRSSFSQEIINTKSEINSLRGKVEELEYKIDQMEKTQDNQSNEINSTLKDIREESKSCRDAINRVSTSTEAEINTLRKKQEIDKKELSGKTDIVIEEVSKENKELREYVDSVRKSIKTQDTLSSKKSEKPVKTEEGYHTVSQGDTLVKISQKTGMSISKIMEINGIKDPNSIYIGQKLITSEEKE